MQKEKKVKVAEDGRIAPSPLRGEASSKRQKEKHVKDSQFDDLSSVKYLQSKFS